MTRPTLLAAASLAVLLAACDQVQLPGQDKLPGQNPAAPRDIAAMIAEEPVDDAVAPAAEEIEETEDVSGWDDTDEPGGETPTVDRDAGPPGEDDTAEVAPESIMAFRPSQLALLNAQRCALPADAAPTPTVASVAGATELEEPIAGTEAVNALAANLSAFPGILKLEPRRKETNGLITSGHCSAVRVRENWLLTAAHCVDQPYDELRVIGDAANLRSPAARVTAAGSAICHGGYQGTDNGYANDIALLHLTEEQAAALTNVPIARLSAPALPLAPANYPTGDMAGWGLTRFGGQLSNELLSTALKITAVGPLAITVSSQSGVPCIGDPAARSMSPMRTARTVVGILSVVEQNAAACSARMIIMAATSPAGYAGWMEGVIAMRSQSGSMPLTAQSNVTRRRKHPKPAV